MEAVATGPQMTLVQAPPTFRSSPLRMQDLEDHFLAWAESPEKSDVVELGQRRALLMTTLARRLSRSTRLLTPAAALQLGLSPATTIAVAADELLMATINPDGPRCRSYRAASFFLRGRAQLEADLEASLETPVEPRSNGARRAPSNAASSSDGQERS
jgi:hypothetical protein